MEANNVAAMRKGLEQLCKMCSHNGHDFGIPAVRDLLDHLDMMKAVAQCALAAPARNCDVGTADEQAERFHHQCFEYHTGRCSPHCGTLPAKTRQECALKWAQLPYEAKEESNVPDKNIP